MAKQKLSKNQLEYNRQVQRIKKAYRRLERSGYRFEVPIEEFVPTDRPKRVTQATLSKLRNITPERLREKTTALSETGEIISGEQAFIERRRQAHRKAQQTRRGLITSNANLPSAADLVLQNVESLIDKYDTLGAEYLRRLLQHDIAQYGRDAVAQSLYNAPQDAVQLSQEIIFYTKKENASRAMRNFANIIRGTVPTPSEQEELSEVSESFEEEEEEL